MGWFKVCDY